MTIHYKSTRRPRGLGSAQSSWLTPLLIVLGALLASLVLGGLAVLAPPLVIMLVAAMVGIGVLAGGYAWAKRLTHDQATAWLLLSWWMVAVGAPALVAFDNTGLTRDNGLFNAQSLSRIAILLAAGCLALANYFIFAAERQRRSVEWGAAWPFWLLMSVAGILSFTARDRMDVLLAEYRVVEWLVFGAMTSLLMSRLPREEAVAQQTFLRWMAPAMFFPMIMNWVLLPLVPGLVFQSNRLGGAFTHPNLLGVIAAMFFFYSLALGGRWRLFGITISVLSVALSFSRGSLFGLIIGLGVWCLIRAKDSGKRVLVFIAFGLLLIFAWSSQRLYVDAVAGFLARGHKVENLTTLSERTVVWEAARILIHDRPWTGHGFVAGAKRIGDVMATMPVGKYFRAPHAHNEFMQAMVNGGIFLTCLLALLYLRYIWLLFRFKARHPNQPIADLFLVWFVLIFVHAMLGPVFMNPIYLQGALLLAPYMWLERWNRLVVKHGTA